MNSLGDKIVKRLHREGFAMADTAVDGGFRSTKSFNLKKSVDDGFRHFWEKRGIDPSRLEDNLRKPHRERSESAAVAESESERD